MKKIETQTTHSPIQLQYAWFNFLVFLILVPNVFNVSYAQGVYKWTDANGKVHYGDATIAPIKSKKIAGNDAFVDPASTSSTAKSGDTKKPGRNAATEGETVAQAFQGLSAERIQKCSGIAKEAALMQISGENLAKGMAKQRNLLDQIRANCTGTGFECKLSRTKPENDRCEPYSWSGKGELLRANIDGTVIQAGPGNF